MAATVPFQRINNRNIMPPFFLNANMRRLDATVAKSWMMMRCLPRYVLTELFTFSFVGDTHFNNDGRKSYPQRD